MSEQKARAVLGLVKQLRRKDDDVWRPLMLHLGTCRCGDVEEPDCPLAGWTDLGPLHGIDGRCYKRAVDGSKLCLSPVGEVLSSSDRTGVR